MSHHGTDPATWIATQHATRPAKPPTYLVQILLDCGCTVPARLAPLRPTYTYGCTLGLGHGYRRRWVAYTEAGQTSHNPTTPTTSR
ncbi:hypothetical protein BX265_6145 [Streptomyces sp. TLI_235]|nr:hypothetical protein [Streptomyces sp. TLI_235]PBC71535.1 hypothetical protein BX265_6145 [Streptomyces sp. TLI_235]